jgi:hypothetical protein
VKLGQAISEEALRQSWQWAPEKCSICLLDITKEDERGKAHPGNGCHHSFHWACLLGSLTLDSTCPNCRRDYSVHGVYQILGSSSADQDQPAAAKFHLPDKRQRGRADAAEWGRLQATVQPEALWHRVFVPAFVISLLVLAIVIAAVRSW